VGIWLVGQTKIIASDDCGYEALILVDPVCGVHRERAAVLARDRVAVVKPQVLLMAQSRKILRDQLGFATHRSAEINVELQNRVSVARPNKQPGN
jgi:hypothetical protein